MVKIGDKVPVEGGLARVVALDWGVPVTERIEAQPELPGMSNEGMMGQIAFELAAHLDTIDN